MGHVNNAVHQYYYDYARLQYFRDVFGKLIKWDEEALVLASISVDYVEPIELEESIEVHTRITRIGNKSLDMSQKIVHSGTGAVKSVSESTLVGYRQKDRQTMSIPPEWRERISWFEHARF
jgi:acyl-CoA thioester hydrolase